MWCLALNCFGILFAKYQIPNIKAQNYKFGDTWVVLYSKTEPTWAQIQTKHKMSLYYIVSLEANFQQFVVFGFINYENQLQRGKLVEEIKFTSKVSSFFFTDSKISKLR